MATSIDESFRKQDARQFQAQVTMIPADQYLTMLVRLDGALEQLQLARQALKLLYSHEVAIEALKELDRMQAEIDALAEPPETLGDRGNESFRTYF